MAAKSRKKKQAALLTELGIPEYYAFVRYNIGNTQNQFFKIKAFQGSGIIYVEGRDIKFVDTLHEYPHTFPMDQSAIKWEDINLVNGLLKWFSVTDGSTKYFFNIESGMFIFNIDSSKPTTKSVFETLIQYQMNYKANELPI
ncbi:MULTISPECIES: hypothetical protein [Chryseobacterium]|uniref:hypothetical protein n=1 Tax=Chryseobacterium TaxID=59732 RepID=UPI0027D8DDA9|nr:MULTISPECIES: hypothetical protein [Chryseobacterium]